jgi:hypothetical protein
MIQSEWHKLLFHKDRCQLSNYQFSGMVEIQYKQCSPQIYDNFIHRVVMRIADDELIFNDLDSFLMWVEKITSLPSEKPNKTQTYQLNVEKFKCELDDDISSQVKCKLDICKLLYDKQQSFELCYHMNNGRWQTNDNTHMIVSLGSNLYYKNSPSVVSEKFRGTFTGYHYVDLNTFIKLRNYDDTFITTDFIQNLTLNINISFVI